MLNLVLLLTLCVDQLVARDLNSLLRIPWEEVLALWSNHTWIQSHSSPSWNKISVTFRLTSPILLVSQVFCRFVVLWSLVYWLGLCWLLLCRIQLQSLASVSPLEIRMVFHTLEWALCLQKHSCLKRRTFVFHQWVGFPWPRVLFQEEGTKIEISCQIVSPRIMDRGTQSILLKICLAFRSVFLTTVKCLSRP